MTRYGLRTPPPEPVDPEALVARGKSGRPPSFTDEQIITALQETRGNVALAAKKIGSHFQTIYFRIQKSPALRAAFEESREVFLDKADLKLQEAVDNGEAWAIRYALDTIGKSRGYGTSLTIEANVHADNPFEEWSTEDLMIVDRIQRKYNLSHPKNINEQDIPNFPEVIDTESTDLPPLD